MAPSAPHVPAGPCAPHSGWCGSLAHSLRSPRSTAHPQAASGARTGIHVSQAQQGHGLGTDLHTCVKCPRRVIEEAQGPGVSDGRGRESQQGWGELRVKLPVPLGGQGLDNPTRTPSGREPAAACVSSPEPELKSKLFSPALPRPPESWALGMSPCQLPIPPGAAARLIPSAPLCSRLGNSRHRAHTLALGPASLRPARPCSQQTRPGKGGQQLAGHKPSCPALLLPPLLPDPPFLSHAAQRPLQLITDT